MYMTEDEYRNFVGLRMNFAKNLIACAHEISQILNDRPLVGDWDEEVYEYDGAYRICCETPDGCGDMSNDCVNVPVEYMYDAEFREYYRNDLVQQRRRREVATAEYKARREANTYRIVKDDRAEYERLKLKFEGDD